MNPTSVSILSLGSLALLLAGCANGPVPRSVQRELGRALTFHAPFDGTTDATFARGDKRLHVGPQWGQPRVVAPGLPPGNTVHLALGVGRHGDALRFEKKIPEVVAFQAKGNVAYQTRDWSGTVSFWLRVTPDEDIAPGYCDPIQLTSKAWDDAAFFTEFTKDEQPREFRFGAYADKSVWNADGRKWEDIPLREKPLAPVIRPPFRRDRWTHVVFTWASFNTGRADGVAKLYLDGEPRGEISPRTQTFTWDPAAALIMLGLSYTGWMDELAIFDRPLNAAEVRALGQLPGGVADLHR